jgi:hypothetical protein
MTHREILLYGLTLGFEILLCALVFLRKLQRRLPFFTAHVVLLLAGTLGLQVVYLNFGFQSSQSYRAYWITTAFIVVTRGLAVVELCRYELRAYQGIWAFAWRGLAFLGIFFLGHAAVDAWGQLDRFAIYGLTFERDVEIASIVILLAMLLIHNYYGLTLKPLHRWIAVGLCLVSLMDVLNSSILRDVLSGPLSSWFHTAFTSSWSEIRPQIRRAYDLWNIVQTLGVIASISIWCFALRKPLPALAPAPELLPAEVYGTLSPAVNMRLRAFNDRLLEMLKP